MNKLLAVLAVATGLISSGVVTASAGVVITETETVISGQPGGKSQPPHQRILMIQGNKQKMMLDGGRAVITDLDKGTMDIIDGPHKNYFQRPFPPHDVMGQRPGAPPPASSFTKTGATHTVAGYKCEDYAGEGKFGLGEFKVVYCVSNQAPGAAEYTKFQKGMMDKLKDSQLSMPTNMPDGIPLMQDNTTRMSISNMPNLPPQAAEQLKKQFANRPPIVTKTEVTKIEIRKIADSEFQPPTGYTKHEAMAHPDVSNMHRHMTGEVLTATPRAMPTPKPKP